MTLNIVSILRWISKASVILSCRAWRDGGEAWRCCFDITHYRRAHAQAHSAHFLNHSFAISVSLEKALDYSLYRCGCSSSSRLAMTDFCRPIVLLQRSIVTAMSHRTATPFKSPQCLSLRLTFSYCRQHTESGIFRQYRSRH